MIHKFISNSPADTERIGEQIGARLRGGEVISLVSDLGGGKTTLTRGLVRGAGSKDTVTSPTFTLSNEYSIPPNKNTPQPFVRAPTSHNNREEGSLCEVGALTNQGIVAIYHFDFYRLNEPGVLADELAEVISDQYSVVIVEWGDIIADVLPKDTVMIDIKLVVDNDAKRELILHYPQELSYLTQDLK